MRFTDTQVTLSLTSKICTEESGTDQGYTTPTALKNLIGIINWTEAVNSSSPNATIPVVSFSVTNAATNVDAAIVPKGTGSVLAQVPNSAASGGNKRGTNSVDLQTVRAAANQIAGGTRSVVGGGVNNKATGNSSTISGGNTNEITGTHGTIGGGQSNFVWTGDGGGGHGTVAGGQSNQANGDHSSVIGGHTNNASGFYSSVLGGQFNVSSGNYSVSSGLYATTRTIFGASNHSAGRFSAIGDAQIGLYVFRNSTANDTITEIFLDGSVARLALPNNSTFSFTGQVVARSSGGNTKAWKVFGTIERGANAAATAIIGTVNYGTPDEEAGASTWDILIDANTTQGALRVQVTGQAATDIRWVARIDTVEVIH